MNFVFVSMFNCSLEPQILSCIYLERQIYKKQFKPLNNSPPLPPLLSEFLSNKCSMPTRCIFIPQAYLSHWAPGLFLYHLLYQDGDHINYPHTHLSFLQRHERYFSIEHT